MHRFSTAALLVLAACQTSPPPAPYSARQIAVLEEQGFVQVGDGWELGMSDKLLFPSNESNLGQPQSKIIEDLTQALLSVGVHGARVVGHTDSTGTEAYNDQLSLQRALAVKSAMTTAGMKDEEVRAEGAGETQPIETNATAAGRQENRRVVIVVTSVDAS